MRYGDLTYIEVRELAEAGSLALLPIGGTRPRGLHLPMDYDTWFAEALCAAAARQALRQHRVNCLVMPPLAYGPSDLSGGGGEICLSTPVHQATAVAVLDGLADQGFRHILLWRGWAPCALEQVLAQFNARWAGVAQACFADAWFADDWAVAPPGQGDAGRAEEIATSLALYLRPEAVRAGLLNGRGCRRPERPPEEPTLDPTCCGHGATQPLPTPAATAERGRRLWEQAVDRLAQLLASLAHTPVSCVEAAGQQTADRPQR